MCLIDHIVIVTLKISSFIISVIPYFIFFIFNSYEKKNDTKFYFIRNQMFVYQNGMKIFIISALQLSLALYTNFQ